MGELGGSESLSSWERTVVRVCLGCTDKASCPSPLEFFFFLLFGHCYFFVCFEVGSQSIAQAGLQLTI